MAEHWKPHRLQDRAATPTRAPPAEEHLAALPLPPALFVPPTLLEAQLCNRLVDAVEAEVRSKNVSLPTFPPLAARVIRLLGQPDPDVRELARAVGADPAVAADVIRIASSRFYSPCGEVDSLRTAIVRIGARTAGKVVIASATRPLFDLRLRRTEDRFSHIQRWLWRHSMTTAFAGSGLAQRFQFGSAERAFLAGMLHAVPVAAGLHALFTLVAHRKRELGDLEERLVWRTVPMFRNRLADFVTTQLQLPAYVAQVARGIVDDHHSDQRTVRALHLVLLAARLDLLRDGTIFSPDLHERIEHHLRQAGLSAVLLPEAYEFVAQMAQKVVDMFVPGRPTGAARYLAR